mgnify:CR=1 FL=1
MRSHIDSKKNTDNSMPPPLTQFLRLLARATVARLKRRNGDKQNRPTECKDTTQLIVSKGELPDVTHHLDSNGDQRRRGAAP